MPRRWLLKNPHSLPMVITLNRDGSVSADFPAVEGCEATAFDDDPWKAREKAILGCAQRMVERMKPLLLNQGGTDQ